MKRITLSTISQAALALAVSTVVHAADPAPQPSGGAQGTRPSASSLLQLDDGRSGRGNLIATTGIRGFSKPPVATAHALIMTIGDYQGNIPKLKGVPFDTATATEIARRLGVPLANIVSLKDDQLTLEGMRKAFDDLESQLHGDDQVFIYYSGHGGRQLVQDNGGERCAESLITVDGRPFVDAEMEDRLKRITALAQKTIVFLDACHSGGVTTRSIAAANPPFSAKSYSAAETCVKPTNMLTRSLGAPRPPGNGGGNFVYIAAARDSEVSLDQPGRGGVASQAWLACLAGGARDRDGSGGLSADEIQSCAQDQIDAKLRNVQGFLPHHVSLTGNSAMVLSYAARDGAAPVSSTVPSPAPATAVLAAAPLPPVPAVTVAAPTPAPAADAATAPAATPSPTQAPAVAPPPVPAPVSATAPAAPAPAEPTPTVLPTTVSSTVSATPPAPAPVAAPVAATLAARPSAIAALRDIYNSRDDRRLVTLESPKQALKIGVDTFDFSLTSREGGYVYLLMVGSDGQTFDLLFPNQLDRNNQVEPGATLRLPRTAWQLTVEGPPGRDTLLAVVTDSPRDFSAAGLKPSGPFSEVQAAAAKDIQLVTSATLGARAVDEECSNPASATRNLAIRKRCSTGYGAAILEVEEAR